MERKFGGIEGERERQMVEYKDIQKERQEEGNTWMQRETVQGETEGEKDRRIEKQKERETRRERDGQRERDSLDGRMERQMDGTDNLSVLGFLHLKNCPKNIEAVQCLCLI